MRPVAACLATTLLAGCGGGRNSDTRRVTREVEAQAAAARDATIPGGVVLLASSGPTREPRSASAEWSFELPADWHLYLEQAEASLRRAGYERTATSADVRAFSKHVPGDSYRVRIARDASPARMRVTVTFWAGPD